MPILNVQKIYILYLHCPPIHIFLYFFIFLVFTVSFFNIPYLPTEKFISCTYLFYSPCHYSCFSHLWVVLINQSISGVMWRTYFHRNSDSIVLFKVKIWEIRCFDALSATKMIFSQFNRFKLISKIFSSGNTSYYISVFWLKLEKDTQI